MRQALALQPKCFRELREKNSADSKPTSRATDRMERSGCVVSIGAAFHPGPRATGEGSGEAAVSPSSLERFALLALPTGNDPNAAPYCGDSRGVVCGFRDADAHVVDGACPCTENGITSIPEGF